MIITTENSVSRGIYDKMWTSLLLGTTNTGSNEISIQITHIEPDGEQNLHSQPEDQCYYLITGFGEMNIDNKKQNVKKGDSIFIPGNSIHGIKNIGTDELVYITANKAFGEKMENITWNIWTKKE